MGGIFAVAARMKHLITPGTPPAGESILYFKNDGLPYCLDPSGTERPLIDVPPSLHANPTFDQLGGGSGIVEWSAFWMGGGATMNVDSVDRVAGTSMRVDFPGPGANGRVQEQSAHALNDTQVINFGMWIKATIAMTVTLEQVTNTTDAGAQYFAAGNATTARAIAVTTAWKRYTVSFTVPAGHLFGRFSMVFSGSSPALSVWYDESFSSATEAAPGGSTVPPGAIVPYAVSAAPAGYLLCNGAVLNIVDWPVLGGLLGATYGGDGTTTFGVPDLRSRFPVGLGTMAALAGSDGQAETARSTAHTHSATGITTGGTGSGHDHGIPAAGSPANTFATPNTGANDVPRAAAFSTHNHGGTTTTTGSTHTHNVAGSTAASAVTGSNHTVPFLSVQYIIKT